MTHVYIIEAPDLNQEARYGQVRHCVKIGVSDNPKKRMRSLRTGCPSHLELLWTIEADQRASSVEAKLHWMYANFRAHGEWFMLWDYLLEDAMEMGEYLANIEHYDNSGVELEQWPTSLWCSEPEGGYETREEPS